jgi:hypothetical protein
MWMEAKAGKRTARLRVQLAEDGKSIEMLFDGHDVPPISFKKKTGRSDPKAHGKLSKILDAEERKTPTKAVTEVVKAVSKEAVKVVSKGAGKGTDK